MSRIGKQPVAVPKGVKVTVSDDTVKVEGPKGTLSIKRPAEVSVRVDEGAASVVCEIDPARAEDRQVRAHWGTTRAHIQNMVDGVSKGYEKTMEIVGVGWQAALAGREVRLQLGFANPVVMPIPQGLTVTVDKQIVKIAGPDKQAVGQFAAAMRSKRKPEPYNGKGIKYSDETIRRKQGKQFGA
ncbi:MAG: 50S ribosomal protein L6 [Phycisphaerales bacterium]|nr:50S ribosomal protein L6 [Phycisphaerales bacterium]